MDGFPSPWSGIVFEGQAVDNELSLILALTRRLPKIRGAGVIANWLKRFYLRKSRDWVEADVLGFKMKLAPAEFIDSSFLFYPQLYDHVEVEFVRTHLQHDSVFVDCGAHIGFYSLVASQKTGTHGTVLAIEADPFTYEKMITNIRLNDANNIHSLNVGVSDKRESLRLYLNTKGNRGGNSFVVVRDDSVLVNCFPLYDLLKDLQIAKIDGLKLDIEGFEFRVLRQFLIDADPILYPAFVIVEHNPYFAPYVNDGDPVELLKSYGYRTLRSLRLNYIMAR